MSRSPPWLAQITVREIRYHHSMLVVLKIIGSTLTPISTIFWYSQINTHLWSSLQGVTFTICPISVCIYCIDSFKAPRRRHQPQPEGWSSCHQAKWHGPLESALSPRSAQGSVGLPVKDGYQSPSWFFMIVEHDVASEHVHVLLSVHSGYG